MMTVVYKHNIFSFFFNDTATTEIYTLSLHDALPIYSTNWFYGLIYFILIILFAYFYATIQYNPIEMANNLRKNSGSDRKSTRLNSSHANISYAVFCLKKKTTTTTSSPSPHIFHPSCS